MNEPHHDPGDLEGYDELLRKLLTLPDEALRALSDDYLRTLSPATQATLRTRSGRPA